MAKPELLFPHIRLLTPNTTHLRRTKPIIMCWIEIVSSSCQARSESAQLTTVTRLNKEKGQRDGTKPWKCALSCNYRMKQ